MVDFIFILIIIIAIGLLGGLVYLLYLPFKIRLKKTGTLTDKLNRQINWSYLLFLFFVILGIMIYLTNDNWSTDNERLEKISDIKIPADYKVLKDEYQDMWQDYCIVYDIQFDNNSLRELTKNIRASKFYNANSFHKGPWQEHDFIIVDSVKAVWSKSLKGYDFNRQDGLTYYEIELDTLTKILKYNECAD